jgi:hypothetical protein
MLQKARKSNSNCIHSVVVLQRGVLINLTLYTTASISDVLFTVRIVVAEVFWALISGLIVLIDTFYFALQADNTMKEIK